MHSKHFTALDSWRGIAALLVALHHFTSVGTSTNSALARNAWLFVDFFFVLSGFIIAANYREKLTTGAGISRFMALRFARLYPLHVLMLLAWIAAETAISLFASGGTTGGRPAFTGSTAASALPAQFLLLQSIGLGFNETWNWVAWSISTEFWTYLVFAAVAFGGAARLDRRLALFAWAAALFILLAPPRSDLAARWLDFARCIYGFALGALIFSLAKRWQPWQGLTRTVLETGSVGLAVLLVLNAGHLPGGARVLHLIGPLVFGAVVLSFAYDSGPVSRILAAPVFTRIGLLSYSIYMIHPFLQLRVLKPLGLALQKVTGLQVFSAVTRADGEQVQAWGASPWQGDLATVAMIVVIIAVAELTYRCVEIPVRDAVRNRLRPAPPSRALDRGRFAGHVS